MRGRGAYKRVAVGGAYGVPVSGIAAWKQGAYASENESECRGAYANGSDMVGESVGVYASGGGANASGAGACCERLCGTFSVMQSSLPC